MEMMNYLAEHFFVESILGILAVMGLCAVTVRRITRREALRLSVYLLIIALLVFLLSLVSAKEGIRQERELQQEYREASFSSPSEYWSFEVIEK